MGSMGEEGVGMMRFLAILALAQAVLAQSGGLMSIYLNPGQNKPATVTLGAGARKMRFSAQSGVLELASANQSVFTMEPTEIGDGQFVDEVIGTVDVKGGMSVTSIFSDDYEILSPKKKKKKVLCADTT